VRSDDLELLRRCERFVYDEAELLDRGDFEGWLDRFSDDAVYWLPVDTSRHEPRGALNLIYDDRRRLEDRIRRLRGGFSHTEDPLSRTSHLIGSLRVLDAEEAAGLVSWVALDDDDVVVSARTVIARVRRDHTDVFHGRVVWVLRCSDTGFTIRVKRVDLLDADQPLPALTFLL
jgi:3-phenylpropionate/cinnamic acid dioxygenase small subunit